MKTSAGNEMPEPPMNSPLKIRETLLNSLAQIGPFKSCVLLDYPFYFNVGDHLIWLALMAWALEVPKAEIRYVSSPGTFSHRDFTKEGKNSLVIFTGGGNLGDLWEDHQQFREKIIARYHDYPVIIMPQSIYFKDRGKLKKARQVFNSHPNLTIFAREDVSFKIARENFERCRIIKSPDIAFYLADRLGAMGTHDGDSIFFHRRDDQELPAALNGGRYCRPQGIVSGDWWSVNRVSRYYQKVLRKFPYLSCLWKAPSLEKMLWQMPEPGRADIESLFWKLGGVPSANMHLNSLYFLVRGIHQMNQFRMVISNRLHGHILCTLLGKPNILLSNSYHKNEAFYNTWTRGVSHTRFSEDFSLRQVRLFFDTRTTNVPEELVSLGAETRACFETRSRKKGLRQFKAFREEIKNRNHEVDRHG